MERGTVQRRLATVYIETDTTASDGNATITPSTDVDVWTYEITGLVEGVNNITVTATDGAGNSAEATASITVDVTAPMLEAAAVEADYTHVDVTYSEAVIGGDIIANYTADNGLVIIGVTNTSGNTYWLTTSQHVVNVTYTITVSGITDLVGNPIDSGADTAAFTRSVNSAPTRPTVNAPADGSEVAVLTPALVVNASEDADGDEVTYTMEVSTAGDFGSITASAANIAGSGTVASWEVPADLTDNTRYYWRALASDGNLNSAYMDTAAFFVNTANDNPGVPGISAPVDGSAVSGQSPVLEVTNAADEDEDTLTYEFDVATDSLFSSIVTGVIDIAEGAGTTAWTVTATLDDNRVYYWRSRAQDEHGAYSVWVSGSFTVNTGNDAPTAPVLASPADNSEVAALTPVLEVSNATDLDGDVLSYAFEVDTVETFNSAGSQTSGLVAEGAGTTSWAVAVNLLDNTTYYWRSKANDGVTDGQWMTTGTFFVNTANDIPGAPALVNPADNSEVTGLTPSLQVNAADVDNDALTYEYEVYSDSSLTSMIAGASGQGTSWTVTPALSDNTRYWWRARAEDEHGAVGSWMASSTFFVNNNGTNDAPAITITRPGVSESATRLTTFNIEWTDSDPDSNATIALYYDMDTTGNDGTLITSGISEDDGTNSYVWDISGLSEGTYYVYGKIDDGVTVVYGYSAGAVTIDRTAPETTAVPAGGLYSSAQEVSLTSNETATIYYTVDGTEPTNSLPEYSGVINITSTTTLKYFGVDEAGNAESVKTEVYTIYETLPSGTIEINNGVEYTNSVAVSLVLSATDNEGVAGMKFGSDGVTWTAEEAYAGAKAWELIAGDGTKTVYVRYKDGAGNWSGEYSDTIVLDTVLPVTAAAPAGGVYNVAQAVTLASVDESQVTIYYTVDGTEPTTASPVYATPINIASTTTLKYFGVDSAENA